MQKKHLKRIMCSLLVCAVVICLAVAGLYASDLITGQLVLTSYPKGVPIRSGEMYALTVRTQDNADFPTAPGLPTTTLKKELDQIADFAALYGFNTLFFEASPENDALYRSSILPSSVYWTGEQGKFTFFDPLGYLVNICKERNIQVYAVVDPFGVASTERLGGKSPALQNPEWIKNGYLNPAEVQVQKLVGKITAELTTRYDIAGVVLSNVDSGVFDGAQDYQAAMQSVIQYAHDSLHNRREQQLGMVVNATGERDIYTASLAAGTLDFVVPTFSPGVDSQTLKTRLQAWNEICRAGGDYYPLHVVDDGSVFSHAASNSLYLGRENGAGGVVISNFSSLHTESRTAACSLAASFGQKLPQEMPSLNYPKTFGITRPADTLTVSTDMDKYFITGTSDPASPVLYDQTEVKRAPESGLWGHLVTLPYGTSTHTFTQGGVSKTATIIRPRPAQAQTINAIVKSSVYPSAPEVVLHGKTLKLSCTAPAGGTVTAEVAGIMVTLQPVSKVQNGIAVVYQQTLDLSSVSQAGQVKELGPVTYRLNYNGLNSYQQSAGEVYVAGDGAVVVAKMNSAVVPISKNGKEDGVYTTVLKEGCADFITENTNGAYYKLSSGGYVLKSAVEILQGKSAAISEVSSISMTEVQKGEKLTIFGTARPVFSGELTDDKLTVTLHNLSGFDKVKPSLLKSALCSSIESSIGDDGSVTLTFTLKESTRLLGWDVQFENNNTIIYLRRAPNFQAHSAQPLSGLTVLVDPGHGGTDPGAAGVPHSKGAWEKTLNLASAYMLRSRLEALGATVHLTQEDESVTLNERIELAEKLDADFFISCHHNAISEKVDAHTVSGIEVYYYNRQSETFARNIGQNLSKATGRKLRLADWSWYRVTMMTARPSVLVESGFLGNPSEYEQLIDPFDLYQYGNAVSDAVIQYVQSIQ